MVTRIAATMALVAFAVCILLGLQARNTFTGVLSTALLALGGTFAVGLVIGAMAQKMLDENLAARPPVKNPTASDGATGARDR